ncbi:MAG TPA: hypothetical protein VGS28_05050 [Candidatus Saccharimonadales bacterium]|nr:hypothetical protein [Candidatus Saccharimonadales bacterium]
MQISASVAHTAQIMVTILLIIFLVVFEIAYSERPKSDRRHLQLFYPFFLLIAGLYFRSYYPFFLLGVGLIVFALLLVDQRKTKA